MASKHFLQLVTSGAAFVFPLVKRDGAEHFSINSVKMVAIYPGIDCYFV